jgi:hypothetical protein
MSANQVSKSLIQIHAIKICKSGIHINSNPNIYKGIQSISYLIPCHKSANQESKPLLHPNYRSNQKYSVHSICFCQIHSMPLKPVDDL